jgi:hypothetical protein
MTEMTTQAIPASIRAWREGGVRPWWLRGSRVTTALPPRARWLARRCKGIVFGVRRALAFVVSLAPDPVCIEDHAANRWVGAGGAKPKRREHDGPPHSVMFEG